MKTNDSTEIVRGFSTIITKKTSQELFDDKGTEFVGEYKFFRKAQGIQIYSTMIETRAAFAERAIRSLKNIVYCYMEDYGYKYIHILPQFVTTWNSRNNCSIDLKPKDANFSNFWAILYSKPLREFRKS